MACQRGEGEKVWLQLPPMQYILTHTPGNKHQWHAKKNFVNDSVANLNIETSLSCHMQIIFKEITLEARFNITNLFTSQKQITLQ